MSAHRWPAPGSPSSLRHPARGLTPTGSRGRPDGRAAGSDAGRHAAPLGTHSGMSAPTRQPTTAQRPPGNGAFSERSSLARIAPRRSCRPICGRDTNVRRTRRSRTSVSGTALIRPDRVRPREPIPHVKRPWVGGRALSRCIGGGGGGCVSKKHSEDAGLKMRIRRFMRCGPGRDGRPRAGHRPRGTTRIGRRLGLAMPFPLPYAPRPRPRRRLPLPTGRAPAAAVPVPPRRTGRGAGPRATAPTSLPVPTERVARD